MKRMEEMKEKKKKSRMERGKDGEMKIIPIENQQKNNTNLKTRLQTIMKITILNSKIMEIQYNI